MSQKRAHGADGDQSRKRREHNWPEAYRKLCVTLIEQHHATGGQDGISIAALCRTPGAPPRATVNSWLRGEVTGAQEQMPATAFDHKSKLSYEEELVVVGHLLQVLQAHRAVVLATVTEFVATFLDVVVSDSWASRFLSRHAFSQHRPASLPVSFAVHDALGHAIDFVDANRDELCAADVGGYLYAIDQVAFWDNAVVTSCFSPVGGYVGERAPRG
tara:strand:- start:75 stop:722 length:648 start_codon:yes stop_codon:yes gene_type:complete